MEEIQNYTLKIDGAGRILIPTALRHELGLKPNSKVTVSVKDRELRLKSWMEKVRDVQKFARKRNRTPDIDAIDLLTHERRREADIE